MKFAPVLRVFVSALWWVAAPAFAQAPEPLRPFTAADRVLVVAPHPDDETLGAAGAIQAARAAGAAVKVVYLTHGDHNEIASIFYLKKPLLRRADFIKSGQIRKREAIEAMAALGLSASDLVFLGYPDSGMQRIWRLHWGAARPFRSFLTRINKVPYKEDFSYGNAYKADNVLADLGRLLEEFRPTRVFVTAPFDLNPDHQAAYLFTMLAVFDVEDRLPRPEVLFYLIHAEGWPPAGSAFSRPASASAPGIRWHSLPLDPGQVRRKALALEHYHSQMAYTRDFLLSFARPNELFASVPERRLDAGGGAPEGDMNAERTRVRYDVKEGDLWITADLAAPLDEIGVLTFDVFPYRDGHDFAGMPKFHFLFFGRKLFVTVGQRRYAGADIRYRVEGTSLTVRVPLGLLREPDTLFVSARTARDEASPDVGSWVTLTLPPSG